MVTSKNSDGSSCRPRAWSLDGRSPTASRVNRACSSLSQVLTATVRPLPRSTPVTWHWLPGSRLTAATKILQHLPASPSTVAGSGHLPRVTRMYMATPARAEPRRVHGSSDPVVGESFRGHVNLVAIDRDAACCLFAAAKSRIYPAAAR